MPPVPIVKISTSLGTSVLPVPHLSTSLDWAVVQEKLLLRHQRQALLRQAADLTAAAEVSMSSTYAREARSQAEDLRRRSRSLRTMRVVAVCADEESATRARIGFRDETHAAHVCRVAFVEPEKVSRRDEAPGGGDPISRARVEVERRDRELGAVASVTSPREYASAYARMGQAMDLIVDAEKGRVDPAHLLERVRSLCR